MQVLVKTHHTKINIEGEISKRLLKILKQEYGDKLVIRDDEWIPAIEAGWYKKTKSGMKPNDHMRAYRISRGYSQAKLGELLGGISRQNISDIENNRRAISKETAKKLSGIFDTSIEKFL